MELAHAPGGRLKIPTVAATSFIVIILQDTGDMCMNNLMSKSFTITGASLGDMREDFMAAAGDEHRMLPLRCQATIYCHSCPSILPDAIFGPASHKDGLHREGLAHLTASTAFQPCCDCSDTRQTSC